MYIRITREEMLAAGQPGALPGAIAPDRETALPTATTVAASIAGNSATQELSDEDEEQRESTQSIDDEEL